MKNKKIAAVAIGAISGLAWYLKRRVAKSAE